MLGPPMTDTADARDARPRIVFLDRATLSPETVLRSPGFAHEWVSHERSRPEEVAARIAQADIVVTNKAPVREAAMAGAPRLKLVAVAATGTDCVDVAAAKARGIVVSNIRDYAVATVPEHTFALMLAVRRSILPYHASLAQGRWQEAAQFCYFDYPIRDLAGSTLGIIGDGALGRSVARIAEAFGMTVLFAAHKGREGMGSLYTPFEEVLRRSDVISLHAPLTPRTRGLIGEPEFRQMARRPILINTARGGLVDEAALAGALDRGDIAGAGFDVASQEPPAPDHPLMRLAGRPNVVLTPHVAWASREAIQTLADQLIANIEAFWSGAPRNVVG
jgi:glycerate dehydrogenase